jgi:23S rRNA (cytidine1920-2'-O)/16S rRNA (cytidine1409-2'-O)-methyltransferase
VRRELAPSRTRAQADIAAGRVLVDGAPASKPARLVRPGDAIVIQDLGPRFVSRAGHKLDAALDEFDVEVTGWRVLDAGASTGGFVDCLLQRGAGEVLAVDVGYGQLHERVSGDPRVRVLDRTNVRHLDPAEAGGPFDLVTADLSFISLGLVLDPLVAALGPGGQMLLLVKPQFEAGRAVVSKGRGIVRDPAVWTEVLTEVTSAIADRRATIMGVMASPITGADGNVEFVAHAQLGGTAGPTPVAAMIDEAVRAATEAATAATGRSGPAASATSAAGATVATSQGEAT